MVNDMQLALFIVFGVVAAATAIAVVAARNPIHSAISLVGTFFSLACIYVLLQAHFLAVIQVLVYAGAIMVLFLFVIMLLNLTPQELGRARITAAKIGSGVIAAGLALVFAVLAVAGGVGTITRRNVVHGLLLLVFTLLNVAAIFLLTQAYFLAVIQILVYAGAIMVLFVFVIMLINLRTFEQEEQTHRRQKWVALILSVLVLAEFVIILAGITFTSVRGGVTPEAMDAAGGGTRCSARLSSTTCCCPSRWPRWSCWWPWSAPSSS